MTATKQRSELAQALASTRGAFAGFALFSCMSNLLMLTGAFFMLQVYDRVLPGRGLPTLLALCILAAVLFLAQGLFDMLRARILLRISGTFDEKLGRRVYDTVIKLPLQARSNGDGLQPIRDFDAVRTFLAGQGSSVLFDLPWIPIYLAIIFAFHPMLGVTATAGALVLVCITILTEILSRRPSRDATETTIARDGLAQAGRRNAEVLAAMGMGGRLTTRWETVNQAHLDSLRRIGDVAGSFGAMSKALRMLLQSAVLAVGAYYVIQGEATAGIIIAGSILAARALAPIDLAIAHWKGFIAARQSWRRLDKLLKVMPAETARIELPEPSRDLRLENVGIVPPGSSHSVVHNTNFELHAGQGLGIVGPSGSGKSSLARALVGVWQPARGRISLDNATLTQWSVEDLGSHIGYLPQDVELFEGTIADNISRFETNVEPDTIIAAAKDAGVHDLIVELPEGYETQLGEHGRSLSAGQRQRVALARALFRNPFLLVLDEPNSNLDSKGELALNHAIRNVRSRGGIVIVIAHRKSALAEIDSLLVMSEGNVIAFGDKDDLLAKALRTAPQAVPQQSPAEQPSPVDERWRIGA